MIFLKIVAAAAAMALVTTTAFAAPLKLEPADPQPSGLKSGLAVKYAYPPDVKTLNQATRALKRAMYSSRPMKLVEGAGKAIGIDSYCA